MGCVESSMDDRLTDHNPDTNLVILSYSKRVQKISNELNPDNIATGFSPSSHRIRQTAHRAPTPSKLKFNGSSYNLADSDFDLKNLTEEHTIWNFPKCWQHRKCTLCDGQVRISETDRQNNLRLSCPAGGICTTRLANVLARNALDLTAPASDALLKNRKNAWVQLAGHPGSFAPAGPHTIWKKRLMKENNETVAYRQLMTDVVRDLVPCFYREVEYNGDFFIEMEDLLQHFQNPSIMDIKMGTRTFLESEVKNPVLRKDLYDKMVKIDPNEPTEEEHAQKSITKLRYMQFREKGSSTTNLGFRLEAIRMAGEVPNTDLKKVKSRTQVVERMTKYLDGKRDVQRLLTKRLKEIRDKFDISEFLKSREIIGSSLLFMYDHKGHAKVWMIDFAKTLPVENCIITHRDTWQLGNHEDGYLSGLENLIDIMEEVGRGMEESSCSRPSCEAASNGTDLQTRHRSHDDSLEKTLASSNPTHSKVNNLDKT